MSEYRIYKHPSDRLEAVKQGWSWPAAVFVGFWALYKKLWVIGASIVFVSLLLHATMPLSNLAFLFDLGCVVVFGQFGNGWRESNLIDRGFELITDVAAQTPEGALAEYLRASPDRQPVVADSVV